MRIVCSMTLKPPGRQVNRMPHIAEDPELLRAFLVESEELLQAVDHDLVKLESAPTDEGLLNRTFRALHTIKGTASFLGLEPIVRVRHRAEDVLSRLRQRDSVMCCCRLHGIGYGYSETGQTNFA